MKLQYSVKWDEYLTQEVVDEMVIHAGAYYYLNYHRTPHFTRLLNYY